MEREWKNGREGGRERGGRERGEGGVSEKDYIVFVLEKTALQQTTYILYTSLGITFIYINSFIYLSHLGITE